MMKSQLLSTFFLLLSLALVGQSNDENRSVQLQAVVSDSPAEITLSWDDAVMAIGNIGIFRRLAGTTSWGTVIATVPPGTTTYTDSNVEVNTNYEYRVSRPGPDAVANGYLYSCINLDAPDKRGVLILVIDDALLPDLEAEIERYQKDVEADGWLVKTLQVASTMPDTTVKSSIQELYAQEPELRHALFLLGHVPVPYAGNIAPDAHGDHGGAWSADVFYADMDGTWTDNSVDNITAANSRNHNVPGDGKWDQSTIPSDLELETGRVDFHDLPHFSENMMELTRRYLDKNHAFRRKHFSVPHRGLIENNFSGFFEGFGQNGLKNFATLVGRDSTSYLDYNTLKTESYLFSYGCGGGNYQGASGIASTTTMATDSFQSVFTLLFGSYFGDWDTQNNFLRAALGSGTILANAWAGRPNWQLHPMGTGSTIGYCAKVTQNNSGFSYDTGFGGRNVHVALMGDPTLRMHILTPPTSFVLTETENGIEMSWSAPDEEDIAGYYLYRRNSNDDFYERISEELVTGLDYVDPCPSLGDSLEYLVKAVRLETSPSGRFYNESTGTDAGIVAELNQTAVAAFDAIILAGDVVFDNQSINATTYNWNFGDGTMSEEENPEHSYLDGQYTVQLIAANTCSADTVELAIEILAVSTEELANVGVQILPNPVTNGQVNLVCNHSHQNIKISLVDVLGRQRIYANLMGQESYQIDVSQLENGTYFLQLEVAGVQAVQQLLLHHR